MYKFRRGRCLLLRLAGYRFFGRRVSIPGYYFGVRCENAKRKRKVDRTYILLRARIRTLVVYRRE